MISDGMGTREAEFFRRLQDFAGLGEGIGEAVLTGIILVTLLFHTSAWW